MEFITQHFAIIISTIFGGGSLVGWIFEKRKNKAITKGVEADANTKEIDNGSKVVEMYKKALEDLPIKAEQKYKETVLLWEKKVSMLTDEMKYLEESYQRKNKLLEDEIKLKNKFIVTLKRELRDQQNENKILKKKLEDAESNSTT